MYNRLKPIKSKENEGKMGVVNLHRKEGGHFQPDLGGQYHRILHSRTKDEIGEMLGHSNSSTTEHYLGTLDIEHLDDINSPVL